MTLRLPLRELEEADADPAGYRAKLYGPPRQPQGSIYFNALRNAIFNFHKPEWTAARAEGYLNDRLVKAPNAAKRAEALDRFRWYTAEHEKLGWTTFLTRLTLDTPPPSSATVDLAIPGQVARVDLVPSGGFVGWMLSSGDGRGWRRELRMPLLQEALARSLNAPIDEVAIGVYAFQSRFVGHTVYSATEVSDAHSRLERLVEKLRLG